MSWEYDLITADYTLRIRACKSESSLVDSWKLYISGHDVQVRRTQEAKDLKAERAFKVELRFELPLSALLFSLTVISSAGVDSFRGATAHPLHASTKPQPSPATVALPHSALRIPSLGRDLGTVYLPCSWRAGTVASTHDFRASKSVV